MVVMIIACKKNNGPAKPSTPSGPFYLVKASVSGNTNSSFIFNNVPTNPVISISFSAPIDTTTVSGNILFTGGGVNVPHSISYSNNDSSLTLMPSSPLKNLAEYTISVNTNLKSKTDSFLENNIKLNLTTVIDSTAKFPQISDSALLTLVEQQTFNYFWTNGDPTSGMAKERASQSQVTTGGSGFGIMAMLVAVQRNFISRTDALNRITTIVNFLTTRASTYHGAFSHWINGTTGATIPFSTQDNGGDIVETSYMMQGLLLRKTIFQ